MDAPHQQDTNALAAPGSTGEDGPDESGEDSLLMCLRYVAVSLGRPYSRDGVLNGLPLQQDKLSVDLFTRAAERLGLRAKLVERRISTVPAMLAPFVVLTKSEGAVVVVGKSTSDNTVQIVVPAVSDDPKTVPISELEAEAGGYLFYITLDDARSAPAAEGRGHWFWSSVRRFWPSWIQIIVAASLINLLGLAMPLFIMNVYDRVIPNLSIPTLWALASGVVVALLFDFVLKQVRTHILDRTGQRVDMKVSASLFGHALAMPMSERPSSAGVIANQIREFESVRDFFTSSSIVAITDLVFIGLFIMVLVAIVGPIAYVPLAAVPVVVIVTLLVQMPLSRAVQATQEQASRRHSILVESLVGIETIKAVGGEGVVQGRWENAVAATTRATASTKFWSSSAIAFTGLVQQAVSVIIIVWGVFLIVDGSITVGGLIAANILAGRVLSPLGNIAMTLARAQQAFAAMRGVTALMKIPREGGSEVRSGYGVRGGAVEFRDVTFTYHGAPTPALSDLTVKIDAGERVGIVGRVGSGKTTMGKLLAGFYHPDQGSILVDEREVRGYDPAALRRGVGFVGQDPELFIGTLRENIILGHPAASEEQIARATEISGVDAFASVHPLGLDLPVGERGAGLSGGQRHAVVLARALLREPRILFLDEPSGAMDSTTEAELISRIGQATGSGETLIVCSHRRSFLQLVDRLLIFDRGRLVADGPRDDVLKALDGNTQARPS